MIGSSAFKAWCACAGIRSTTYLSTRSGVSCMSAEARVSSSVSIESGPVEVHGDWDVVHAPWSIGRVVLRIIGLCLVGLVLITGAIIIAHITKGAIVGLESSFLIVIVALEVSKRSSSKS